MMSLLEACGHPQQEQGHRPPLSLPPGSLLSDGLFSAVDHLVDSPLGTRQTISTDD